MATPRTRPRLTPETVEAVLVVTELETRDKSVKVVLEVRTVLGSLATESLFILSSTWTEAFVTLTILELAINSARVIKPNLVASYEKNLDNMLYARPSS